MIHSKNENIIVVYLCYNSLVSLVRAYLFGLTRRLSNRWLPWNWPPCQHVIFNHNKKENLSKQHSFCQVKFMLICVVSYEGRLFGQWSEMMFALSAKFTRFISTSMPRSLAAGLSEGCLVTAGEGPTIGTATRAGDNGFNWGRIVSWNFFTWAVPMGILLICCHEK